MSKVTETRQQKGIYVRKTLGLAVLGAAMTLAAGNAAAADGSFTGEAQGMGPVSVGITVANGRVSAVQVNVANETPGYGRDIGATMEKRILEAQSADVDGVSGATITSTAVKAAAKSAFAKAGLVAAAAKSPVKAGTYVGSAQGAKSRVHATVKVDEKGRFTIEKITSGDTPYVSDSAFAFVEKNIEDGQTLAVDALTGATLSSRGLVGAVSDALRQAGVDTASLLVKQSAPVKVSREEETADVVVIGGGAAGMAAALAAKTTDRLEAGKPNGLKVVLLETKGYLGGDLAICGGYVAAYSGTVLNERTGLTMSGKEVVAATKAAKTPEVAAMVNDELAVRAVDEVGPLLNSLVAQGFRIVPEDATRGATNSPYFQDGILHYTVARTSDMRDGYRSQDKGYDTTSGSPWMAEGLSDLVKKAGVDVRLMTSATDLVRGANGIETVSVADGRSTYRIRAKAVVLATGYSGLDAESVKLFYPRHPHGRCGRHVLCAQVGPEGGRQGRDESRFVHDARLRFRPRDRRGRERDLSEALYALGEPRREALHVRRRPRSELGPQGGRRHARNRKRAGDGTLRGGPHEAARKARLDDLRFDPRSREALRTPRGFGPCEARRHARRSGRGRGHPRRQGV